MPPPTTFKIDATPERLARGKYLSDHVVGCTTCHTQARLDKFSGPVDAGTARRRRRRVRSRPGRRPATRRTSRPPAIGSWTDGELLRAVTQGVSKDGTPLFPLMPYPHFGAMAEEDIHAVLAYIRSLQGDREHADSRAS